MRAVDKPDDRPNSTRVRRAALPDPKVNDMILDNLFSTFGGVGTAAALMAVLALIGTPAIGAVACPTNALRRMQPRGR